VAALLLWKYGAVLAGRTSDYLELPNKSQSRSRVGVFYTFLGSGGFGAVR
jgi:hypothetical protein